MGGETPRLEGESEKECAAEWGGVREPSEDGENIAEFIAEFDISAGGEPENSWSNFSYSPPRSPQGFYFCQLLFRNFTATLGG